MLNMDTKKVFSHEGDVCLLFKVKVEFKLF